ncbi:MAG: YihY family inner membrane protein [Paucibacter sp.]|nr:YihY family inner membrane protein [Roseateles sp.]
MIPAMISDSLDTLRGVVHTLRERFREGRLGQTAGSLTFTTLISLVPLITVGLALFSAFPMFKSFQAALEQYFLKSLVPDTIAKPVLASLTLFASKASRLGTLGLVLLGVSALAMVFTIDRTLNTIWQVQRPRPLAQRVLVYWAALTLGPLALGGSLAVTSYAISASGGLVQQMPGGLAMLLEMIEFVLLLCGVAGLFHYVPNTHVRWRHAFFGAGFVAVVFTGAKSGLAWYVKSVPTYSTLYGAFATVPIFLIWLYLGWIIMLVGAVLAASAPSLVLGLHRRREAPGLALALAVEVLRALDDLKGKGVHGLPQLELAQHLRIDPLQLEPVLDRLLSLDLIGRLEEEGAQRLVLLCDPAKTPAAPLLRRLLARRSGTLQRLWDRSNWETLKLAELF